MRKNSQVYIPVGISPGAKIAELPKYQRDMKYGTRPRIKCHPRDHRRRGGEAAQTDIGAKMFHYTRTRVTPPPMIGLFRKRKRLYINDYHYYYYYVLHIYIL